MPAIVLNTATGAVTEYGWSFNSATAARAASDAGLFTLGGDTDAGAPITGEIRTGRPGAASPQTVANVYLAIQGDGDGVLIVQASDNTWEYPVLARSSGISRVTPGKGIRDPRLGFGYRNTAGADFRLDRLDAEIQASTNRRRS